MQQNVFKNNDDENEKKYIYKIIYLIYLFVYCPKVNRMLFKVENMHIELFVCCVSLRRWKRRGV